MFILIFRAQRLKHFDNEGNEIAAQYRLQQNSLA
jgi:hypothetical protein